MFKLMDCVVNEHDLRLVALSAVICILGCITTTTLMARAGSGEGLKSGRWLPIAAIVFGCSVWALHFVAMLAFTPARHIAYDVVLTATSVVIASLGAMSALAVWQSSLPSPVRIGLGGILFGAAVTGMHYVGVAAMAASGLITADPLYVGASIVACAVLSAVSLARAADLGTWSRRIEAAIWLALAICSLHFTGMAAIAIAPGAADAGGSVMFGTTLLAVVVGTVSVAILIATLTAVIIDQHLSQRAMQELARMRLMGNLAQEVLLIHRDGTVLEMNGAGERLFKVPADEIIGHKLLSLFTPGSVPALIRRDQCPPVGRPAEEFEICSAGGVATPVELSCQPIDYLGRPATVVALRDLTDRRRDEARIRHLARHDALTNLPNRHTLLERLETALAVAAQKAEPLALFYIDLDRFKPVNDLHGHAAGDALLVQASKRILAAIRTTDTLARIGGDEFVAIVTSDGRSESVSAVAGRIIEALRKPFHVEGSRLEIGASVGIAIFPGDGTNPDTLLRAADAAMYCAKGAGRGSLRFYEAAMNDGLQARLEMEQELAGAVDRGELMLHYQPMVNGRTGVVETFEALIRWNSPTRGLVPPVDFIPLAEQTGMIDGIGRWVIETACRDAAGWKCPCRVSVNVSPKQFQQSDVCETIASALRTFRLDPARLVVEVTEGVLIDDIETAVATLNRLRKMGVRIALDDFGTGYSSLSYLQRFKFDKFKIDKSFIRQLGQTEDALTLTRTIVNLAHNLGLHVTAEGVESPEQLAILQQLGCDQIQGYVVGRPAPIDAWTEQDRLRTLALFQRRPPVAPGSPVAVQPRISRVEAVV